MIKRVSAAACGALVILALLATPSLAAGSLKLDYLKFSPGYVKPGGQTELSTTVENVGNQTVEGLVAELHWPAVFTLLYDPDGLFEEAEFIDIGDLEPGDEADLGWTVEAGSSEGKYTGDGDFDVELYSDIEASVIPGSKPTVHDVYIDGTAPTLKASSGGISFVDGFVNKEKFSWSAKLTDNFALESFSFEQLDGGVWKEIGGFSTSATSSSQQGSAGCPNYTTCTFRAVAQDQAGNVTATAPFAKTVDTTPPVVTVKGPAKWPLGLPLTVSYEVHDVGPSGIATSWLLPVDQALVSPLSFSAVNLRQGSGVATMAPGAFNRTKTRAMPVTVQAKDWAGNQVTKNIKVEGSKEKAKLRVGKARLQRRAGKRLLRVTVKAPKAITGALNVKPYPGKAVKLSSLRALNKKGSSVVEVPLKRVSSQIKLRLRLKNDPLFANTTVVKKVKLRGH